MNMKGYEPYQANSDPFKCISGYNDEASNNSIFICTHLFKFRFKLNYSLPNHSYIKVHK